MIDSKTFAEKGEILVERRGNFFLWSVAVGYRLNFWCIP